MLSLLLLLATSAPATAATVRCIAADGRIVYQDTACPPGSRAALVDDTPNSGFRFAEEKDIRRMGRPEAGDVESRPRARPRSSASRPRVKHKFPGVERRFITTGMSVAAVKRKIGPPDSVVRLSVTSATQRRPTRDTRQRWVYLPTDDDPQTTTTLTIKSGLVLHVERNVTR